MKILFLNVPMQGHINPTLPIVEDLVKEGYVVDYYCNEANRKKIEATGANFKDYGIDFEQIDPTKRFQMINGALKFVKFAKATVDKFLFDWKKQNYDLVIYDSCAYAGVVLGHLLDVKIMNSTTTMFHTVDTMKKTSSRVAVYEFFNSIFTQPLEWLKFCFYSFWMLKKYSIRPTTLSVLTSLCDLNVTYTARELQPHHEVLDSKKFKFLGSIIKDRPKDPEFPYERLENTKVVYVSLGTVYTTNKQFLVNCIEGLREIKDILVVMSLGPNIDIKELGDIPENFIIRKFIPQLDVLKKADVFVSHAGNNSLNESLSFGVPMVLCPQQGEQRTAAFEFERMGMALNTKSHCPDAQMLRTSVERLLVEDKFKLKALKASRDLDLARQSESFIEIIQSYV